MGTKIIPIPARLDIMYLLQGDGTIMIDGGDPGKILKIRQAIEKASIHPQAIHLIVLTHGHWDHVGSAMELKKLTGAKILLHQKDLHLMVGSPPPEPGGFNLWGKIASAFLKISTRSVNIAPLDVDILATDEDYSLSEYGIPGKVVHTPGHSWGSVSVVLDSGEAFVGDLGTSMFPMRFNPGLPIFGDDMELVKNSWRKLRGLGVKTIYPAHGKPFPALLVYQAL